MKSKVDIWMPLYVKDYLAATSRLTTEQHGCYLLLIMDYWQNGPIPDDDIALANITRLQVEQWTKHRPSIERLFDVYDGEWHHKRIDKELNAAQDRREQAIERGKKGARARWSKDRASIEQALLEQSSKDSSAPAPAPAPASSSSPAPAPARKVLTHLSDSRIREPDNSPAQEVFKYWREKLNHPRAKLDDKRRRKIRDRLKDGYTVGDLMLAIDGCAKSPYHRGDNKSGAIYDDLELICRDGKHVDQFIKISGQPDMRMLSAAGRKTATAAMEFINE